LKHQLHEAADQVGTLRARQHQEAGIVGDQSASASALLVGPADELVAVSEVKGGGTPGCQGQPIATIHGRIPKMLTDQRGVMQLMVLDDESVAPRHFIGVAEHDDSKRIQDVLLGSLQAHALGFSHSRRVKIFGAGVPQNRSSLSAPIHYWF